MTGYFFVKGTDPNGAERIELTERMLVGRSEDCDLRVQDGHPSRRHAELTVENGELWVEDLGSANGTRVNDQPIETKTRLHAGDRVAFDLSTFVVVAPAAPGDGDGDATVLRRPTVDPNATVVRPPPPEPAAPAAPAAAPTPPPEPPAASSPPPSQVPRSWADPEFQAAGTRVLTAAELRAMATGQSPGEASGDAPLSTAAGPHLVVISGKSAGTLLEFPSGNGEWTVGTDAGRDLKLHEEGVSAFHAKISHDNGRWRVIDQMSANGTFVNDEKSTVSYLKDGDRVRFAQVECEFRLPRAGAAGRTGKPTGAAGTKPARSRSWLIAAAAAAITAGALALVTWLG